MTIKTITSQRTIAKVLTTGEGCHFLIKFADLSDPVWRVGDTGHQRLADVGDNSLDSRFLACIAAGEFVACKGREFDPEDGCIRLHFEQFSDDWWLMAAHMAAVKVVPAPTAHRIDGMTKDIVLHPEGHAVVGCQTITRKGLEQLHDLLTKHLGRG